MSKTTTYEGAVPNHRNLSKNWQLEVFENDGQVGVGLSPQDGTDLRECLMEVNDAEQVLAGLEQAIRRAKAKLEG